MTRAASARDLAIRIRVLNDNFRTTFVGGRTVMTQGVAELPLDVRARLILAVQSFDGFTPDDDPHGEHDFGSIEIAGDTYFWKIDYYAPDLRSGAENAATPEAARILTIMRADEY
jgi:Protein of unknown function (DUF3768)